MKKKKINVKDYAGQILTALPKGILLNTSADGKDNTMVIGWGSLGEDWGKDVFTVYVRKSRYTYQLLQKNPEFTISVPLSDPDPKVTKICGSQHGDKTDKFEEAGLTKEKGEKVKSPAVREYPLTLECRVVYSQEQTVAKIQKDFQDRYYPLEDMKYKIGKKQDAHTAFYGEILDAYILEGENEG